MNTIASKECALPEEEEVQEDHDDDHTENHGTSHNNEEEQQRESLKIAISESQQVWRTRIVLVIVLVVVAGAICASVYWYAHEQERLLFENTFYELAGKVADTFESNAARRLNAIESLAVTISSNAVTNQQTWPNVTVDDYERRLAYTLDLAAVVGIIFVPFVTKETRKGYEAYTVENQGWLKEGLALQGYDQEETAASQPDELESIAIMEKTWGDSPNLTIPEQIFRISGTGRTEETTEGPYAPFWQFAPVFPVPNVVNYNAMSHPSRLPKLNAVIDYGATLVSEAWDYADVNAPGTVGKKAALNLFMNHRPDLQNSIAANYQDGPVSDLYVPIFQNVNPRPEGSDVEEAEVESGIIYPTTVATISNTTTISTNNNKRTSNNSRNNKVVGTLTAYVWWQVYFHSILPTATPEIIAILENTCGQSFSYSIQGTDVTYIGQGALHNSKYNDMVVSTGWNAFLLQPETMVNYTMNDEEIVQCTYQVRVYPSQDLEDYYMTNTPVYFMLILIGAFVLTSLVFVVYDCTVERRNRIVMKKAVQSTEVVNTLYPAAVRDRMFGESEKNPNPNTDTWTTGESALSKDNDKTKKDEDDGIIADMYESTTILFADLAGFTKWSDGRNPKQVFRLLETLYGAFDEIAKRRSVFKVETIGDCYLAICGCPTPNDRHALVMTRFAAECMTKMDQVIQEELVDVLGPDTANLQFRVGLHSGGVTAGVLRGERARFQLFGDTVNTASRMESLGVPGKIQASETTANLLLAAGKGDWLTEREGGIEAKGKGNLKTWFVQPKAKAAASVTSSR